MNRKNLLFILISLFAVSILLSGCGSSKTYNNENSKPIVKSDVPSQQNVPVKTTPKVPAKSAPVNNPNSVVDNSFDTNTASENDTVAIGSLIN